MPEKGLRGRQVRVGLDPRAAHDIPTARGVARDYAAVRKWCRLAGAPKHNRGRCDVGYGDRHGYGVETDDAQAIPYYQQAADQGCPIGAYWLAYAYEHGEGVKRDRAKARHWYDISSQRGDQDAAAALARLSPR